MKILFWMSTSFKTTSRHLLISILDEMIKAGHDITVFHKNDGMTNEAIPPEIMNRGVHFVSIPVKPAKQTNLPGRYINDIRYILKCKKYITPDFDAVFLQSTNVSGFMFFILQKRIPKSLKTLNVQDAFPDNAVLSGKISKYGIMHIVFRLLQSYAYKKADKIITISEDIKESIQKYGIPSSKIFVVYNWSYKDDCYSRTCIDSNAIGSMFRPGFFQVLYAGNIGIMQNVDLIINAAALLKNDTSIWFNIIGNGAYKENLERKAHNQGITNISFYPLQSAELAPVLYCYADVNIVPLKDKIYRTALPSKTATCLACQQPIIFALGKESKFGKWISSKTGCPVVDCNDANELATTIIKIKNGTIKCSTGLAYQSYFSKTNNSHKYVELITAK